MIRRQPALEQFPGLSIQPARHYRSCVHIQPYTPGRLSNRTKLIVFGGPQGDPLTGSRSTPCPVASAGLASLR
jgi:hypothetical protein